MKVIFISTKAITFNTFLKSQANFFIKKGFKIRVACSDSEKLKIKKNLKYRINFPNKKTELFNFINYIKIFSQIKILIEKNPSAIYYLHTPLASHLFRLFTFFKKLKIIYFVHGFRFTSLSNPIKSLCFKLIEKILSFKTDIFITINKEDFNYSKLHLSKRNSCYKINGVGLDLSKNHIYKKMKNKKGIKEILVIAAYKKDKGYFEILKLAEMLKNKPIKIHCYGYGNYYKFNSIKIRKKLKNITFNSFDFNLDKKIKNFDLLLHLSKREGLPVAVMQSLAQSLPVICYNIRGNNDLITDKFNGYFIKSYKEVPNKISYLNLENNIYNQMRFNAFQSINKDYFKNHINLNIYEIIKNYSKNR